MSEWKREVEDKARKTAIEYALNAGTDERARNARSAARKRRAGDAAFGIFGLMMGVAVILLAAGLFLMAGPESAVSGPAVPTAYLILGTGLVAGGLRSIAGR